MENITGIKYLEQHTDFDYVASSKLVESNCTAITFINVGDNTMRVNGHPLSQSESLTISQPAFCIDRTQYQITFDADGITSNGTILRIQPKNQSDVKA